MTRGVTTLEACSDLYFKTQLIETVMIKTKKISLLVCLAIGLLVRPAFILAQSDTRLREDQKSVVVLDLRVDQMIKEFVAAGFQEDRLSGVKLSGPFEGIRVAQIERVYGATCLPKDITTLSQIMADSRLKDFPVFSSVAWKALTNGCFLQIKLTDKAAVDEVEKRWKAKAPKMDMGGFVHNIPWGQTEGDAFFAHRVDETTLELGSKAYLQQANRKFFTDRLNAAYQSSAGDAFRLVLDLETRQELLKEVIKLGKMNEVPRTAHAYLDLAESLKSVTLAFSFNSENLMSLVAEANGDSDAEEFADGINSLLQIGKIGSGTVFAGIAKGAPEGAQEPLAMLKGMIDELKADRSDATVKVQLKKPENFVAMLGQFGRANADHQKEAARKNVVRRSAVAVKSYATAKKHLPFKADPERAHPSISWRVKLLRNMRLARMARQMDLKKGTNENPNAKFASKMPAAFGTDGRLAKVLWIESAVDSMADVKDGVANTIMLIESPEGRPWMENKPLTLEEAVAMVKGLGDGQDLYVGLYDGSIATVTNQIADETLRNLFSPNDGNEVDGSWKK